MENKQRGGRPVVFYPGRRIGYWTIVEVYPYNRNMHCRLLLCRCVCGTEKLIRANNINKVVSCGCIRQKSTAQTGSIACAGCNRLDKDKCADYRHCDEWRQWFHREWTGLQKIFLGKNDLQKGE